MKTETESKNRTKEVFVLTLSDLFALAILGKGLDNQRVLSEFVEELGEQFGGKDAVRQAIVTSVENLLNRPEFVAKVRLCISIAEAKELIFGYLPKMVPDNLRTLFESALKKIYPEDFPAPAESANEDSEEHATPSVETPADHSTSEVGAARDVTSET